MTNCFILNGRSAGLLGNNGKAQFIGVIVRTKRNGEWVDSTIKLTTFSDTVVDAIESTAGTDAYVTVTGRIAGRQWEGKHLTDVVADTCAISGARSSTAQRPQREASPLDDIPF